MQFFSKSLGVWVKLGLECTFGLGLKKFKNLKNNRCILIY